MKHVWSAETYRCTACGTALTSLDAEMVCLGAPDAVAVGDPREDRPSDTEAPSDEA